MVSDLAPALPNRYTGESFLRTRPRVYRKIVQRLAQGDSINSICLSERCSNNTVLAIQARERLTIAERKQALISVFSNVAEISAERMEQLAGKAKLTEAGVCAGIATDKLLQLSGEPNFRAEINVNLSSSSLHEELNDLRAMIQTALSQPKPATIEGEYTKL